MLHFIIRSYNFTKPFEKPDLAVLCCNDLIKCHSKKDTSIPAFCLMPDHLHLCINTPVSEARVFVGKWKSFITHASWKLGWQGKLWQPGIFIKETRGDGAEKEVIEYVLHNPERAGFVKMWKEWPYWAEPIHKTMGWHDSGEAASGLADKEETKFE